MRSIASPTDPEFSRPGPAPLIASVLFVVSLVAAAFYGSSWAIAANDGSVSFAAQREEARRVGSQAIVNFNTLDYHNIQHGLDLWAKSSTGPLHEEVVRGRKDNAARIEKAKATTEAQVLDAAITELDDRAGKARMIAVVKVTVTPEGKEPVDKRSRYQAELTREGKEWKLSGLGPVSVG